VSPPTRMRGVAPNTLWRQTLPHVYLSWPGRAPAGQGRRSSPPDHTGGSDRPVRPRVRAERRRNLPAGKPETPGIGAETPGGEGSRDARPGDVLVRSSAPPPPTCPAKPGEGPARSRRLAPGRSVGSARAGRSDGGSPREIA